MTISEDAVRITRRVLALSRIAYGAESRRSFVRSVWAVPLALAALPAALRRPPRLRRLGRALVALPVAVTGSTLTGTLAFLVLINVLGYPFRPWLGLDHGGRDIWTGYADSWGGPTLIGAWFTHAAGVLLLMVPPVAWAVRRLSALQQRLTGEPAAPVAANRAFPATYDRGLPQSESTKPGDSRLSPQSVEVRPASGRLRRTGAVLAALGLLVAFSLTAHANGIGDNLLWTPRDVASSLALAATLAPVAALLLLRRTTWWSSATRS